MSDEATAVTVCVRCRPMSAKEIREGSKCIIAMEDKTTSITDPSGKTKPHPYTFDHSFWSYDPSDTENFATQQTVFEAIGTKLLDNIFDGFNSCLFAYGQTGSGKTYSMMGYGEELGIIPRLCKDLFNRSVEKSLDMDDNWEYHCQVSYLEIYNEKCRCLLTPQDKGARQEYKVREHPTTGPYVENLSKIMVHNFDEIQTIMEEGNRSRTVASTAMNATSSRSHAIFTITFHQKTAHEELKAISEMSAKLNLVDLAGSERADRTGATGDTLKEGSNINKSLTTLGKVIHALAEGTDAKGKFKKHVPFRDSALTWLLKENLSGNSKTVMLAALSPAESNFDETLSTLRYADRAKQLKTSAIVNEDPSSKKIRELTAEIERLRALVETKVGSPRGAHFDPTVSGGDIYDSLSIQERIDIAKKLLQEETLTWEEQDEITAKIHQERKLAFEKQGMALSLNRKLPSLVNLNEDPAMSECLVYYLNGGKTIVGCDEDVHVHLEGRNILPMHAVVDVEGVEWLEALPLDSPTMRSPRPGFDKSPRSPRPHQPSQMKVTIAPLSGEAQVRVNGDLIKDEPVVLHQGDRVIFGDYHVFRFHDPMALLAKSMSAEAQGKSPSRGDASDYHKAMEERFEKERAAWLKGVASDVVAKTIVNSSFVTKGMIDDMTPSSPTNEAQMRMKITELQQRIDEMEQTQKTNLHQMFQLQTSVEPAGPLQGSPGASEKVSSLASVAKFSGTKAQRLPPQQVFKYKIVLIGHQEVGKTSLRKCFESDPFFFKKLPEVQSTTGIEAQRKEVKVEGDQIDMTIQDFAGQEMYHSHSLFLTARTVFCLVWKISAVEQDYFSRGIEGHEESRLYRWIAEVYAKYPHAALCLIATHLDELRDQGQKAVSVILTKVQALVHQYIEKIARTVEGKREKQSLPIVGNFAVSCKNRVVMAIGPHVNLGGKKISALLEVLAGVSRASCIADPVFWGGAIPGRHLRLITEIQELAKNPEKMLLPLAEYVHLALRSGVESDKELLEVTQLMHSWNNVYMFNQQSIADNPFLCLHPLWLCRLAGVLFSFAHVISTPQHLRSGIGGLEYGQSAAENADMGMMRCGYIRFPVARVIFLSCLKAFYNRQPEDQDFEMCLKVLNALELIVPVTVPCSDPETILQENPGHPSSLTQVRDRKNVIRYFIPSLSPFKLPSVLRHLAPCLFNRGVHVSFNFNLLPNEFWWRLQYRLHKHLLPLEVKAPHIDLDEDFVPLLPEASDIHSRWNDAMWLGNARCRVLVIREGFHRIQLYSAELGTSDDTSSDSILSDIEAELAALLKEYRGVKRTVRVACPVQDCRDGGFDVQCLPDSGTVQCDTCKSTVDVANVVVTGTSSLGPKNFPLQQHYGVLNALEHSLDDRMVQDVCDFLGIRGERTTMGRNTSLIDEADMSMLAVDFMTSLDKVVKYHMLNEVMAEMAAEIGP